MSASRGKHPPIDEVETGDPAERETEHLSASSSGTGRFEPLIPPEALRPPTASPAASPPEAKGTLAEWDAGEEEELQRFVTTRMARLTRDPHYARTLRLLAGRRRARAALSEILLLLDVALSLLLLFTLAHFQYQAAQSLPPHLRLPFLDTQSVAVLSVLVLAGWPITLSALRLYAADWARNLFSVVHAFGAALVAGLCLSGVLFLLQFEQARGFFVVFVLADALLLALARVLLRPLLVWITPRRRVLIVGTGRLAVDAARAITARHKQGLQLVGVAGPMREMAPEPDSPPHWQQALYASWVAWRLGELQDVPQIVHRREVDLVLIALSPRERHLTSWVVSGLAHMPVQVSVIPDVVTETAKTAAESLDGMPVVGLTESAIAGWNARLKRLLDLCIAVPALVVLWPLMAAIAVLIRLTSPGPALFRQERVGQHARRFQILKFRTMYLDAEQRAKELAIRTGQGLVHKQRNDPRITQVGAFLRKTSLDELPQLLNVLKGDMSIVGPRPELPWIVERYRAWQYRRLLVPQGITGWWQVHGRSDRVLHLHTQDDIYYVRNYSLWLDIKILLMTIKVVLTGRGAF
jgi:exopolysaccharide biosynthesis polyprenyl glycosylphosphotransferase